VAESWLDELIALHDARWRAIGQEGAFASPKRRAFHFGFLRSAVPRNEAYVMRIRTGTQTVGVLYGILSHGLVNFYQSGFHTTGDPHLKPGLVSHCLAIRHFAAAGYREYDFLASAPGESRYKQSLATNQRDLHWLTLSRPSYKHDMLRIVRGARRAYRSWFAALRGARLDG
jgi:CelD/BcsL family acetyltransferase involved in cellulose biosynthesis